MPNTSPTEYRNNDTDRFLKEIGPSEQGTTLLNQKTVSAANTAQAQVLAAVAGQRVTLRKIVVFASAAPTAYAITVQDGAGVVLDLGTSVAVAAGPAIFDLGAAGLTATTGNSITVNIGAAGVGITTTLSLIADRS